MEKGEEEEECCICFTPTENFVTPCFHRMCKGCFLGWSKWEVFCPLCKTIVVSPCPLDDLDCVERSVTCVPTPDKPHAGLTLTNDEDGVRVKHVLVGSFAYDAGVSKRSVITHINDIPVDDHTKAICIVDQAQTHFHSIRFTLKREGESVPLIVEEEGGWSSALRRCLRHQRSL